MPRTRVYQGRLRWPGVVLPPEPPPSGEIFGPTVGDAAVRANAGARAVSDPGGGTPFTSPSQLASLISAGGTGVVYVAANSMDWSTTFINTGTKAPKIWIPTGRVMNGNNSTFTVGLALNTGAELHGGEWINFGSESAPVSAAGTGPLGTNAVGPLIQDVISHDNFGKGINVAGSGAVVDHCTCYNNGRYGIGSNQPQALGSGSYITNVTWQYVKWYGNNTRNLSFAADAGGSKLLHAYPTAVRNCWAYSNNGSGLWMDFNPGNHEIEENVFELNSKWGIFYEMGTAYPDGPWQASADIHNNYLKDNVTADDNSWYNSVQLLASCSDGAYNGGLGYEIHHNYIDGAGPKILGWVDHASHPLGIRKCHIHDNDVWIRTTSASGKVGSEWSPTGTYNHGYDPNLAPQDNTFENNHYHVPVGSLGVTYWRWSNTVRTWAQWQSLGHDNTGSLVTI